MSGSNASCSNATCVCFNEEPCTPTLPHEAYYEPLLWSLLELALLTAILAGQRANPLTLATRLRSALCGPIQYAKLDEKNAPSLQTLRLLVVFVVASALLVAIGHYSGFLCNLEFGLLRRPSSLLMLPINLVFPGLVEEVFWRGVLLPAQGSKGASSWSRWHLLALGTFIVYHLDAMHCIPRRVFRDPRFLCMALVLGAACTEAYIITGTVWLGALWHGLWVWAWLGALGECPSVG